MIRFPALFGLWCIALPYAAPRALPVDSGGAAVDWILEDALKEENVPLLQTNIVTPAGLSQAMAYYKSGNYRFASHVLEKLRDLNLPDGRLDFIYFALAECYGQLNLKSLAIESYRTVTSSFPGSEHAPPSYFRLLQYACEDRNGPLADTLADLFTTRFGNHPLVASVMYVKGKLLYRMGRYADAAATLAKISSASAVHPQAQFLSALCCLQTKDPDKALLILEYVRKNSMSEPLISEAAVTMGDIYFGKEKYQAAISYYSGVSKTAKRYPYAVVKTSRAYLEMRQFAKARDIAKSFIERNKYNDYNFEMVSILGQAYAKLKDNANAVRAKGLILQQLKNARYAFELNDELGRVAEMARQWEILKFSALQKSDNALLKTSQENLDKLGALKTKLLDLSGPLGVAQPEKGQEQFSGTAERRYLDILKDQMARMQDTMNVRQAAVDSLKSAMKTPTADSSARTRAVRRTAAALDSMKNRFGSVEREYAMVLKECLGNLPGRQRQDEDMQAKYVDWAFINYQDKKTELVSMNKELMQRNLAKTSRDTLKRKGNNVAGLFTATDAERAAVELIDTRSKLIGHISAMLYSYPQSRYTPAILMRLAELYFDQASDEFDVKLRDYEKKMAEGAKGQAFPEFDLSKVITAYDRVISGFPRDENADNAYFYKALALQKLNKFDEANAVLVELTKKYPESEFFVEANMNIARYYFERPKIKGGKGYKLAEEAYHKVLYYRDHPQFVSALYSLGWCYYMQDQFDEAIAVFKYLIEEVALDFDVTRIDEKKQMMNPLLRDEAIDYIAISFDEEKRTDDAIKFLTLIGNIDYAAMVLKRIAELREEDMDYPAAVRAYERLLKEYPQSIAAPDASLGKIKLYEMLNKRDDAFKEREDFFMRYAKGGQWQSVVWKRDSLLIPRVDSIAISIGQFIADENFRIAEAKKDTAAYSRAARCYQALVNAYPGKPRSVDARWNLAVILDNKLNRGADAFVEYIGFSKAVGVDSLRREQAALNAIALAQKMLPPDSALEEGKIEASAGHVIEAVNNYKELFPGGKHLGTVLLTMGSIYFNRKMFAKAAESYETVIKKIPPGEEYYEALFLLAQCHFGKENWELASKAFDQVAKNSPNEERRGAARKFFLQSEFSRAKQAFGAQAYKNAAEIFLSIENRYPGSEYGDAVLFKAAECFEKTEKWTDACDAYFRLARSFPKSKLAPSALFNAATDYEKAGKYDKAAEAYELLAANYGDSDKTKDALFNLGLCYEKLGNAEKVAEANERYTRMFPGEKDVEAILLRTAEYYVKANMTSKAVVIYRNFIRQFSQSPKTVEALFMIGKVYMDHNDRENAVTNFNQAELQHQKLLSAGSPGNTYAASEAAFALAKMKREECAAITFTLPDAKFKADQKTKATLLLDATKAYERVIKYQNEKMFEAAYWIGQMYEEMAETWKKQERPKLDPIKTAVFERDVANMASTILQKSFVPFKKAVELSAGFDSITSEQKNWVHKTKVALAKNYFTAGVFLNDAIAAMQNAPVPEEIRSKPLYHYQYLKQLLETIEPMKLPVRNYFLWAYKQLDSLKMLGENSAKCLEECGRVNFSLGYDYDKLAEQILRQPDLPKDMTVAEKEDLTFQLEDIVYELQDKAIFNYEDAFRLVKKETLLEKSYNGKILQALARLSPDKYGKSFYQKMYAATRKDWQARSDSVFKWNAKDAPMDGWKGVTEVPPIKTAQFPFATPMYLWQDSGASSTLYLKKHLFFNGVPRDAAIHYAVEGKFWLYINGILTASDTTGARRPDRRDSITGISKLFVGGGNEVAMHVQSLDSLSRGVAMSFSFYIDTTQHFVEDKRRLKETAGAKNAMESFIGPPIDTTAQGQLAEAASSHRSGGANKKSSTSLEYDHLFRNRGELVKAIADYQTKARNCEKDIKRENFEVQKLRVQNDDLDAQIKKVKDETAAMKKAMEEMKRGK
jgi:tetratricopeptide (TPR) repeat protein